MTFRHLALLRDSCATGFQQGPWRSAAGNAHDGHRFDPFRDSISHFCQPAGVKAWRLRRTQLCRSGKSTRFGHQLAEGSGECRRVIDLENPEHDATSIVAE
jgi:hypothetical protein